MLKAKIEKDGYLKVERRGEFMHQDCPRLQDNDACGDHCIMFGEAELETLTYNPATREAVRRNVLKICKGVSFEVVE